MTPSSPPKGPWQTIKELDEAAKRVAEKHGQAKAEADKLIRRLTPKGMRAVKP